MELNPQQIADKLEGLRAVIEDTGRKRGQVLATLYGFANENGELMRGQAYELDRLRLTARVEIAAEQTKVNGKPPAKDLLEAMVEVRLMNECPDLHAEVPVLVSTATIAARKMDRLGDELSALQSMMKAALEAPR